jgi:hypothetical protein
MANFQSPLRRVTAFGCTRLWYDHARRRKRTRHPCRRRRLIAPARIFPDVANTRDFNCKSPEINLSI